MSKKVGVGSPECQIFHNPRHPRKRKQALTTQKKSFSRKTGQGVFFGGREVGKRTLTEEYPFQRSKGLGTRMEPVWMGGSGSYPFLSDEEKEALGKKKVSIKESSERSAGSSFSNRKIPICFSVKKKRGVRETNCG